MNTPDYQPWVNPAQEYDTDSLQLAIEMDSLRGTINAKIGKTLIVMQDGVYIPRATNKPGEIFFALYSPCYEA
jgi:sulfur relay (sulfurtransferase) complex TusBCD TusD component (DsrE family)